MRVAFTARHRRWLIFLAVVLAVAGGLYLVPGAGGTTQTHGAGNLKVSWVANSNRLELIAEGFRPRSSADVKVGDQAPTGTRADRSGAIRVEVSVDIAAAGRPGTSVIIYGRGPTGASRTLFAAVPPRASARGPLDLLPWSLALFAVAIIFAGLLVRLHTSRNRALREAARQSAPTPTPTPAARGASRAGRGGTARRRRR